MKRQLSLGAGVCLLILIASFAFSQQWTQQARVTVGFEFVVGDTVLPAGTYSISTATEANNLLRFVNSETGASAMGIMPPSFEKWVKISERLFKSYHPSIT